MKPNPFDGGVIGIQAEGVELLERHATAPTAAKLSSIAAADNAQWPGKQHSGQCGVIQSDQTC